MTNAPHSGQQIEPALAVDAAVGPGNHDKVQHEGAATRPPLADRTQPPQPSSAARRPSASAPPRATDQMISGGGQVTPQPTPTGLDTAVFGRTLAAHRPRPATVLDTLAGLQAEGHACRSRRGGQACDPATSPCPLRCGRASADTPGNGRELRTSLARFHQEATVCSLSARYRDKCATRPSQLDLARHESCR